MASQGKKNPHQQNKTENRIQQSNPRTLRSDKDWVVRSGQLCLLVSDGRGVQHRHFQADGLDDEVQVLTKDTDLVECHAAPGQTEPTKQTHANKQGCS